MSEPVFLGEQLRQDQRAWLSDLRQGDVRATDEAREVVKCSGLRAAREERQRVSANLSEQHKAAVARKLQAGARRFLGVLRSRALLRAEWRCPPSPSNGQQLVICLWLLRFFDPVQDGVALCTLCRAVVAGMRPALGAPAGVPLRTHPCVNQEWSRTSRP